MMTVIGVRKPWPGFLLFFHLVVVCAVPRGRVCVFGFFGASTHQAKWSASTYSAWFTLDMRRTLRSRDAGARSPKCRVSETAAFLHGF